MQRVQRKKLIAGALTAVFSFTIFSCAAPAARAGECYADPRTDSAFTVKVVRDVFVRDNACTTGTKVLTTLSKGTVLSASADWGGWYKVTTASGISGWSWGDFFEKTSGKVSAATGSGTNETCGGALQNYSGTFKAKEQVRLRTKACTTGDILTMIPGGTSVAVLAKTDGWFKVKLPDGRTGWSSALYYSSVDGPSEAKAPVTAVNTKVPSALKKYRGRFVESKETKKVYYFHPTTNLLLPATTIDDIKVIAKSGEKISSKDLAKIPVAGTKNANGNYMDLRKSVSGKILSENGDFTKSWYVYPDTKRRVSLDFKDRTLLVARSLASTLTQKELVSIDGTVAVAAQADASSAPAPVQPTPVPAPAPTEISFDGLPGVTTPSAPVMLPSADASSGVDVKTKILYTSKGSKIAGDGSFQQGAVPPGVNLAQINAYVLNRINTERTKRGQFKIVSDQRLIDTASVWAGEMHAQGQVTHTRLPKNVIARVWAWDNFKLDFAESWGWFYENIGGGSYDASSDINASIERSLDKLIDYFMSEESTNGIHFQTIMHDHLTHLGVGFYFDGSPTSGKLYTVMHYGALAGRIAPIDKTW